MDAFRVDRFNFLRRGGQSEAGHVLEQQQQTQDIEAGQQEMAERATPSTSFLRRFSTLQRPALPSFFGGRSSTTTFRPQPRPSSSHYSSSPDPNATSSVAGDLESPKTPRFSLSIGHLPSTRLHLPHLTRTWTEGSNGPDSRPGTAQDGGPPSLSRMRGAPGERFPVVTQPVPAVPADSLTRSGSSRTQFHGADPAEVHLAELADDGRRRRDGHRRGHHGSRGGSSDNGGGEDRERRHRSRREHERRRRRDREHGHHGFHGHGDRARGQHEGHGRETRSMPKHFLFCFPWIKSRRIRSQILQCFVSGLFLTLLLAVYLALSLTKNINNSEFTVMLILIILFTTIFFCHGLIRLCMLIVKPPTDDDDNHGRSRRHNLPEMYGPGGYAIPRQPIRVVLASDEEAAGLESETTKTKPPAYGLWRESVRVDPNRFYWQRNDEAPTSIDEDDGMAESSSSSSAGGSSDGAPRTTVPRPPSYASDDGVMYVVEAQPRSIAPTMDVPLAPHPAEAGRLGRPSEW